MTREEAINIMSQMIKDEEGFLSDNTVEAHKMAIKALEQEPSGDLISRQVVIDITWEEPSYTDALNVLTEVRDKVKALPSVKPQEPKTGHWRHYEGMLICSECGDEFYDDIMEYCGDDVPKCCPNCGFRMVEPQERSDKE